MNVVVCSRAQTIKTGDGRNDIAEATGRVSQLAHDRLVA